MVGADGIALYRRDATAQCHTDLFDAAGHVEAALGERAAHVFNHGPSTRCVRLREQQAEHRAIEARRHVVGTRRLFEQTRRIAQQHVGGLSPMAGRDLLESIDLQDRQRQWSPEVTSATQLAAAVIFECGRRRQLRQVIAPGLSTNIWQIKRTMDQQNRRRAQHERPWRVQAESRERQTHGEQTAVDKQAFGLEEHPLARWGNPVAHPDDDGNQGSIESAEDEDGGDASHQAHRRGEIDLRRVGLWPECQVHRLRQACAEDVDRQIERLCKP